MPGTESMKRKVGEPRVEHGGFQKIMEVDLEHLFDGFRYIYVQPLLEIIEPTDSYRV